MKYIKLFEEWSPKFNNTPQGVFDVQDVVSVKRKSVKESNDVVSGINKAFSNIDPTQSRVLKTISYLIQGRDWEALSFIGNKQASIDKLKEYLGSIKPDQMELLKKMKDGDIQNHFRPSIKSIVDWLQKNGLLK